MSMNPTASDDASDIELLRRLAAGDGQAVGALYDRYAHGLFALAMRILRDRAEAEDVVHDAFVQVGDRAGQFTADRGSVRAWLVTLVRNLAIDRTRRHQRRGAIDRRVQMQEPPAPPSDPETLASDAAERAGVRRALASLPDDLRATLETAFFEGLSYPEIAAREGVPLGTIKSRTARALARLRAFCAEASANCPPPSSVG